METLIEVQKRGNVTIPEVVRKALGIGEGSIISIEIKEVINLKKDCLFSWSKIPGNDSTKLIEYLKQKFEIEWIASEHISKSEDDKITTVSNGEKSLLLRLNNEKTKVNLMIDEYMVDKFTVTAENGELNVYKK